MILVVASFFSLIFDIPSMRNSENRNYRNCEIDALCKL